MIDNHEGGYVDHPLDPGGATKYGITQRVYERWIGHEVNKQEMKDMPIQTAIEIYREEYFFQPKINLLPAPVQHVVFDMSVNHGQRQGVKLLQQALRDHFDEVNIDIDGRVGPQTIRICTRVIDRHGAKALMEAIVQVRLDFYDAIIKNNPSQEVFRNGWRKRAKDFLRGDLIASPRKEEKPEGKISNKSWKKQ